MVGDALLVNEPLAGVAEAAEAVVAAGLFLGQERVAFFLGRGGAGGSQCISTISGARRP